tara:strand:- start:19601 stop:20602 length:1002 start_codon:yes stop_codon:yes gene_type:complete
MKKIIKYSKKISDVSDIKKDFFSINKKYLNKALKENQLYISQTKRKKCKNCNFKISKAVFESHKVKYTICNKCSHLNGIYEDTNNFINQIYLTEEGSNYVNPYKKDFNLRVKKIYGPKANFLKKVLKKRFSLIEIGCGAGHFIKACEKMKIKARGYDVNKDLIDIGKKHLKKNKIKLIKQKQIFDLIKNSKEDVVAMISTLEHLQHPNLFLKKIKKSDIKYLYIVVPLFSLSSLIENVFENVYPRQLSGSHTHLYTGESIDYMIKKNNFKILGEWWFGTDISDLFRSMLLNSKYNDKKFLKYYNKFFGYHIDELQNVLDKKKISCEVHMVLKV